MVMEQESEKLFSFLVTRYEVINCLTEVIERTLVTKVKKVADNFCKARWVAQLKELEYLGTSVLYFVNFDLLTVIKIDNCLIDFP